ncbi:MAG: hypothetical protein ACR2P8_05045 [Myxococcota bacterium]
MFGRWGAPELGAVGSAWATGIAYSVSLLLMAGLWLGGALLIAQPRFGTVIAIWCCLLADWGVKAALLFWRFSAGRWRDIEV